MANPTVYVVHCVDAEGPLQESRANSSERDDWVHSESTSSEFRGRYADPTGQGWIYNWFVTSQPRSEEDKLTAGEGAHSVLDRYSQLALTSFSGLDEVHWHFRPSAFHGGAADAGASLLHYPEMTDIMARFLLERGWFPTCFHPGPYAERPDTHWFLEQWIPFDYANRSVSRYRGGSRSSPGDEGSSLEWRRAVWDWSHYRPSYDDIQREGSCNRTIFKCLPAGNHERRLDQAEVELAFRRADEGYPTVLAFSSHDSMDLRPAVEGVYGLLKEAQRKFPNVRWEHSGALNAARQCLGLRDPRPLELEAEFERTASGLALKVRSNKPTFGSQPFLALKTKDGRFHHGSFETIACRREWICKLEASGLPPESISRIGIASSDAYGHVHVSLFQGDGTPILPLSILLNVEADSESTLSNEEMIG